jgi:DNA-binding CsgD family transcriptional regulator
MIDEAAKKQRVARADNILLTCHQRGRRVWGAAELLAGDENIWLGAAVLGWLDRDSCPRLIVGERFDIHWCNPSAERLLAQQIGLESRGDVLTATDGASQTKLRSLLQDAQHKPASACIEQTNHDGWLVLRCVGVESGAEPVFCLAISRAADGEVWRFDHLDECFELTRAEHRVLQELLAGYEAEALSTRHAVSIETTRTHIKSIYAKIGVKTREALFARLRGFRA